MDFTGCKLPRADNRDDTMDRKTVGAIILLIGMLVLIFGCAQQGQNDQPQNTPLQNMITGTSAGGGGGVTPLPTPICKFGEKGCIKPQPEPQPMNRTALMERLKNMTIHGFIRSSTPPVINSSVVLQARAQTAQYTAAMNAAKAKFPIGKGQKIDMTAYQTALSKVQNQYAMYQVVYSLNGTIRSYTKVN